MPLPMTRKSLATGTIRQLFPAAPPGQALGSGREVAGGWRLTSRDGSRIVTTRMRAVGMAVVTAVVALARVAAADIYLFRDRFGVLHFTNAAADGGSRLVIKEYPLPPGPRMSVPAPAWSGTVEPTRYDALIREIAARHDVEYALVKAVIKAESAFDRLAVSPKGARGLMQLMPATAAQHQVRNVFLPRDNIEGGCRHLRMLLDRYGGNVPLAVAAYNAGTQRVEEAGGIPRIAETREYLSRVLRYRLAFIREGVGVQARR